MDEFENVDDFIEGTSLENEPEVNEEEAEPVEEPEGEQISEPPAEEESPQPEPVVDESAAKINAFQRMAEDERHKRQQLEAQIHQQQEEKEKPDFWENPEEMVKNEVGRVRQEIGQEFQARLLNMSESSAMARHEDYGDKFNVFQQMVQRDPAIYQQMLQQPDPAEYAYRAAKRLMDIQSIGDVDSFKQQTRAEIRAEIEAEVKAEFEGKLNQANSLPQSFSEKGSKSTPRGEYTGMTSFESILG